MKKWTYEKAGVPHLKGDRAYNRKISQLIRSTHRCGVMGSTTGFASLFDLKKLGMKDPLLVSSTDGVGTKLELAHLQGRHDTIGMDLVAMCVNDLITTGARPLFFLDYFAAGKFHCQAVAKILSGIVKGCRLADCALVGGETAIMPGFYQGASPDGIGQYDLAGFSVGAVERRRVLDGASIKRGHLLIGMASSGVHSNGFSLVRKVFSKRQLAGKIGQKLLTPTRIYVRSVRKLLDAGLLSGLVNITGGGLVDNLPRVIPTSLAARIHWRTWQVPKIFELIRESGNINFSEMIRTFNMGIGMVAVAAPQNAQKVRNLLKKEGMASWVIGETASRKPSQPPVFFEGAREDS